MIEVHIEPRAVKTWEKFKEESPRYSIALDGYVVGRPSYEPAGPFANFNHHEDVDRLGTRSTGAQLYVAIKQGLFTKFSQDGEPYAHLFVNDPDQDVCLSKWLAENSERINGTKSEPLITRLVAVSDLLDTTGGTYPLDPSSRIMRELAWIYEPYNAVRFSGKLAQLNEGEMRNIIEAVCSRISEYTLGRGKTIRLDTRYEEVGGGVGWVMIKELGPFARSELFAKGVHAFVSVRDRGNEHYDYTLGRTSPFIDFPIEHFYKVLNDAEELNGNEGNHWGGGDTIGGSPRKTGSKIKPDDLIRIINGCLKH